MRAVIQALNKLFRSASRISTGTSRGLLQHGAAQYGILAVRKLNFSIGGVRIAYQDLSEADQKAVDEVVQYVTRFAHEYVQHHDENSQYRIQASSLEEVLESHAQEIMTAAKQALISRARSHAYDAVVRKPVRTAVFMNEDYMKQLVTAVIDEVANHYSNA